MTFTGFTTDYTRFADGSFRVATASTRFAHGVTFRGSFHHFSGPFSVDCGMDCARRMVMAGCPAVTVHTDVGDFTMFAC
jgi:hypothetical protein